MLRGIRPDATLREFYLYYYPHHIGDFISDTARLTDGQCMAYLRLIWHYYDTEKPLENDPESLAFKIGSLPADVSLILKHYFVLSDRFWVNNRCEKVITEYHSKADKARNSANARWSNANAMRTHSERIANESLSDANQQPITNNQQPIQKKKYITPPVAESLVTIFDHWSMRMNHGKAKLDSKRQKLINNALNIGYSITDLTGAIDGCAKSPYHMGTDGRNTTVYDSLELILRDAEHIDKFIKLNSIPAAPSNAQAKFDPLAYVNSGRAKNDDLGGLNTIDQNLVLIGEVINHAN
jgi:uncharacterized protein YdaU (DUF1376 family)